MQLSDESQRGRLEYIAKCEGVKMANGAMEALLGTSNGDLRSAINTLQMVINFSDIFKTAERFGRYLRVCLMTKQSLLKRF